MSSQIAERAQNKTRRSIVEVKRDYDKAAIEAANAQLNYDCSFFAYETKYEEGKRVLRGVRRRLRLAEQAGKALEADKWRLLTQKYELTEIPDSLAVMKKLQDDRDVAWTRLETLRAEIDRCAGIPTSDIKIVSERTGSFSIYFGGIRRPDGPGHAHYAFDASGELHYRREPDLEKPVMAWRR